MQDTAFPTTPQARPDHLVLCPHCDSTGLVMHGHHPNDPAAIEAPCGTCDGTGRLDLDEATDRGLA